MKKLVIGCDEAAYEFKESIRTYLEENQIEYEDLGVFDTAPAMYPNIAIEAAEYVKAGKADHGILMCGTGIGMAISANKVKGIRAAVAHDSFSMRRSILSNDCQFICFGSRIIAPVYAQSLLDEWLLLEFSNEQSAAKLACIGEYETKGGDPSCSES